MSREFLNQTCTILQPLQERDIPSLFELEQGTFLLDGWSLESIQKEACFRPHRFTVIKEGEQIIAYVRTQLGYDTPGEGAPTDGIISSLAVLKSHRRKGLGEKLLKFAIGYLRTQGARKVIAYTRADNIAVHVLNRKVGFKEVGPVGANSIEWGLYCKPLIQNL